MSAVAPVSDGWQQQGGEQLDALCPSLRDARPGWLADGCAACRYHSAERVCALEAADATRRFPCAGKQAGSATICLMPHIRSRLLARARRRYGADQHHQPRHTACAASVCCVLSVRCGGCSLGPLSVDRLCDCVPASLCESVSTRTNRQAAEKQSEASKCEQSLLEAAHMHTS